MNNQMKRLTAFLTALFLFAGSLSLSGCNAGGTAKDQTSQNEQAQEEQTSETTTDEHQRFTEFTKEQFCSMAAENAFYLHYYLAYPENYGITDYEAVLPVFDEAEQEEEYDRLRKNLEALEDIDYELLPVEDRLTYDVLEEYLKTNLEGEQFDCFYEPFALVTGVQSNLPVELAEYTFRRERDVQDYLELLESVPAYLDSLIAYERARAEKGFVLPADIIDEVLEGVQNFLDIGEEHILLVSFEERLEGLGELTDSAKTEYIEKNGEIVETQIIPVFGRIAACLQEIQGSAEPAGGLCYTEGGSEYYAYLMKSMVGSGHSPEEWLEIIEDRIWQDMTEIEALLNEHHRLLYSFSGSISEERTPEEILSYLSDVIKENYPELPAEVSYQIKYVPEYMEESSSPAFYMMPPYDLHDENIIYINRGFTGESELFSTLAHEGYPGHLYQIVYASEALSDPVRYLTFYLGYAEGWATYAEAESYAWNGSLTSESEDSARLYRINAFTNLALQALADLKVHYEGCGLEELKAYFADNFGEIDEAAVESLYRIIISEPAYFLTYYGGYLEFLMLREKAEEELGEKFDLKGFHKFLLDMGSCSFPVIETYMESWIAEQK